MAVLLTLSLQVNAQHETEEAEHELAHAEHGKHKIAAFMGFTHIDKAFYEHETHEESTGKWVPTIGLEYYYDLSKRFDVGLVTDIELDQYYINTSEETELERNNVWVTAVVARFKPIHRLGIIAGPGFETEFIGKSKSETFFVFKVGVDYEVEIAKGWELSPVFSYDFKEEYGAYSFGMSIGKRF